jgi:hypothetical protein
MWCESGITEGLSLLRSWDFSSAHKSKCWNNLLNDAKYFSCTFYYSLLFCRAMLLSLYTDLEPGGGGGVNLGGLPPLHVWMHPLAICRIPNRNLLINTLHNLPHPTAIHVLSVEPLWLDRTDFQKHMCKHMFCVMLQSELCNYGFGCVP